MVTVGATSSLVMTQSTFSTVQHGQVRSSELLAADRCCVLSEPAMSEVQTIDAVV